MFRFTTLIGFILPIVAGIARADTFTVTNVADSGAGSLRFAILDANSNQGHDDIVFDIPGVGPHAIQPHSGLPPLVDSVTIDGYTQPGASPNTNPTGAGSNAVLMIELDGSMAADGPPPPSIHGLIVGGGNSTIRGLVINRFITGDAIRISTPTASVGGPGSNVIEGNFLGTDVSGTVPLGNNRGLSVMNDDNRIGGSTAAAANVISANEFGVWIASEFATGNAVMGNYIGTDAGGTLPLGNSDRGIFIGGGGPTAAQLANVIGGPTGATGNVIAFNGNAGVYVLVGSQGNAILSNAIFENGSANVIDFGIGIDLSNSTSGVTVNDVGDADDGANALQNFPELLSASMDPTAIEGLLNSTADTTFVLQFFANVNCDPTGYGEGEEYLGSTSVTTDSVGNASFVASFPSSAPVGRYFTATATDPNNNTSEFSFCIQSMDPEPVPPSPPVTRSGGGPIDLWLTAFLGIFLLTRRRIGRRHR